MWLPAVAARVLECVSVDEMTPEDLRLELSNINVFRIHPNEIHVAITGPMPNVWWEHDGPMVTARSDGTRLTGLIKEAIKFFPADHVRLNCLQYYLSTKLHR